MKSFTECWYSENDSAKNQCDNSILWWMTFQWTGQNIENYVLCANHAEREISAGEDTPDELIAFYRYYG
jgi:hypothetical protein